MVRALALLASLVLLVAACDNGGGDAGDEATGEDLDFAGALFTVDDLESVVPGDYVIGGENSLAGKQLRSLCDADRMGPEAASGELVQLRDADETMSLTTLVQAFATADEAEEAFAQSRAVADSCEEYVTNGMTFVAEAAPEIARTGDESFDLFVRTKNPEQFRGDHVVRRGRFVFDVRVGLLGGSPFSEQTIATMAEEADAKFADWVDDQTAG